jgi:hypothetical protein
MACTLIRQDDGTFAGKRGRTVRVDVQSDRPASVVRISYAGEQDGTAPFEFTVKPGRQKLLITALGVDNDQRMKVVEIAAGQPCHLKNFFWSATHFHTTLDIVGA